MHSKTTNPAGVTTPRSECPYGKKPEIGIFLTAICVLKAFFPVLERFFSQSLSQSGFRSVWTLGSAFLSAVFLLLSLSALFSSDSPAIKIGFFFCSLSAAAQGIYYILILSGVDGLLLCAGLTIFSCMMLTAGFLVFSICRDHTRETARASAVAAVLLIPHTVLTGLVHFASWSILQNATLSWLRFLNICGSARLFIDILLWMTAAVAFLFMRTDVPNARYPARLLYEACDDKRQ